MFTVCHYTAPTLKQLPVTGRYEMKVSFIPIVLVKYIDYQVYIYLVKDNTIYLYLYSPKKETQHPTFFSKYDFSKKNCVIET